MDGDDPHVPTDLATAPEWTETAFDWGTYGPDEYDGLAATFEHESMTVSVVPVRYECSDGRERLRALDGDLERTRREQTAYLVDVPRRTAFATHVECRPYSSTESAVPFVAADAGDALAVAVWLTRDADTDRDLWQAVRAHRGERPAATVSDDDALAALFAADPTNCLFTGQPTTSHRLRLPYRYVPALENGPRTSRGVVRFPSTVDSVVGAVSHTAWEEHGLADASTDTSVTRSGAGEYELHDEVLSAVADADASALSLRRLGER